MRRTINQFSRTVLILAILLLSCSKGQGPGTTNTEKKKQETEKTEKGGSDTADDFRDLAWGMTKAEVQKKLNELELVQDRPTNLKYKARASGHDVQMMVWFRKGYLYKGDYTAYEDDDRSFFDTARVGLLELYGKTVSDDKSPRSQTRTLKWVTPRTTIELTSFDTGGGRSFNTDLSYTSNLPAGPAQESRSESATQGL